MATRTLNRRKLREQVETAAAKETTAVAAVPSRKKPRVKAPAAPRVRKVRAKKAPPRMVARWGLFDLGMKQVAIFDYNQRTAADAKLADLNVRKKGGYFLQLVKEPLPEPAAVQDTE